MNTPAHIAASLFLWRSESRWKDASAVTVGAILPDATMFLFYGYEKLSGASEEAIWGTLYFLDHWQYFCDIFNSIPIALVALAVAKWTNCRWAQLLVLSSILHMLCDLPVHHDDGHRHFLPFSHWRFASPVSYWDPKHFGLIVAPMEAALAVIGLVYVLRTGETPTRRIAIGTLAIYLVAFIAALAYFVFR